MRISVKNLFALSALAATLTLASCQNEPITPQAAPARPKTVAAPTVQTLDDDQPPKSGNGGH